MLIGCPRAHGTAKPPVYKRALLEQVMGVAYDLAGAALALPLVPADGAVEPQPTWMDCFAC